MSIFRIVTIASALTLPLALAACGGGTAHASCKDKASADVYARQWGRDLSEAVKGGKVPRDKADAAARALTAEVPNIAPGDFGALCNKMDELRKETGF